MAGARVERFEQIVNTFDPFGLFVGTVTTENNNTDVFPAVNFVQALRPNTNLRLSYSATVNRPEFRELAPFEFTDVVGSRAVRGNPDLERALHPERRRRAGSCSPAAAASSPPACSSRTSISRSSASSSPAPSRSSRSRTPTRRATSASSSRSATTLFEGMFVNANYTFVDSKITLPPEQRTVQTSLERPLAGQSKNLFNLMGEYTLGGFSTRLLVNYFGDRISDVGSNEAPDIVEEGRGIARPRLRPADRPVQRPVHGREPDRQRVPASRRAPRDQRVFKLGRTFGLSVGLNVF